MHKAKAKITYYNDYCVAYCEQSIADYYFSLIPKYYNVQKQAWPPHITVVRRAIETPKNQQFWKKHDGQEVEFQYTSEVHTCGLYFWLNVISEDISLIREELGLSRYRELFSSYHLTLGNRKILTII